MDDETFLHQFETCTLPFDQWTHRAHVKVAYLYLVSCPFQDALAKMRDGIRAYNAANDVPEGPTSGYHETMTHAWMRLIDLIIREHGPGPTADAFFDDHPQLSMRQAIRFFYSRDRFLSPEAKERFVEPDLVPFPAAGLAGATQELIDLVHAAPNSEASSARKLARALDRLALVAGELHGPGGASELDWPWPDQDQLRALVCRGFPELGYYNSPAEITRDIAETELHVGDAVDDLMDIVNELLEVLRCLEADRPVEAEEQFIFGYRSHWADHLADLRRYLHAILDHEDD